MSAAVKKGEAPSAPRVVVGRLERVRRGKRTAFEVPVPKPVTEPTHAGVALTLALAHAVKRAIDAGEFRDQAEAARQLGTTRARITQILDLTLLSPWILEAIMTADAIDGARLPTERAVRAVVRHDAWPLQELLLAASRRS
jgi:hypothetical protein